MVTAQPNKHMARWKAIAPTMPTWVLRPPLRIRTSTTASKTTSRLMKQKDVRRHGRTPRGRHPVEVCLVSEAGIVFARDKKICGIKECPAEEHEHACSHTRDVARPLQVARTVATIAVPTHATLTFPEPNVLPAPPRSSVLAARLT